MCPSSPPWPGGANCKGSQAPALEWGRGRREWGPRQCLLLGDAAWGWGLHHQPPFTTPFELASHPQPLSLPSFSVSSLLAPVLLSIKGPHSFQSPVFHRHSVEGPSCSLHSLVSLGALPGQCPVCADMAPGAGICHLLCFHISPR